VVGIRCEGVEYTDCVALFSTKWLGATHLWRLLSFL